nr:hypothetical protein [uncultured Campylobacter sp.]
MKKLVAFLTLFITSLSIANTANTELTEKELIEGLKGEFNKLGLPPALQGKA